MNAPRLSPDELYDAGLKIIARINSDRLAIENTPRKRELEKAATIARLSAERGRKGCPIDRSIGERNDYTWMFLRGD